MNCCIPAPPLRQRTPRTLRGLTLIELLVGVAIVTALVGVGVPGFKNFIANQERVAATNDLVAALTLARNEALKSVRHVSVCRSRDGAQCAQGDGHWGEGWIVFANSAQANVTRRDEDEALIRVFPGLREHILLTGDNGIGNVVAFRPTGDTDFAGTIVYCDARGDKSARSVIVERSGRAYVADRTINDGELECDDND